MTVKKRKPVTRKAKPSVAVEHRLTRLEDGMREFREDIAEIKEQIKTTLTSAIKTTNDDLKILLDRKKSYDAVKVFVIRVTQFSISLASITWVVIQILRVAKHGL